MNWMTKRNYQMNKWDSKMYKKMEQWYKILVT